MPTTSILINNYNNGRFIAACVDSALAQTVPADEIIVYDDGSTDESLTILRAYGDRIQRLEGVHDSSRTSRESQSRALEEAFRRSKGEWLFLMDGDDVFAPRKIERVLAAVAGRTGISLVQSPMWLINEHGAQFGRYRDARFHETNLHAAMYQQHDVDFFYPTSAMVVSRSVLSEVLPIDMTVCPELACDTRIGMLMPLLGEVITLDEPLAFWRRHSGSYLSGLARSRWFSAQQTIRRVRTFNRYAPRFAARGLSLWRNRRLCRQLAGALLPQSLRQRWRKTGAVLQPTHAEV